MSSKYSNAEQVMATQLAYLNAEPGDKAGDLVNSILMKNQANIIKNSDGTITINGDVSGLNKKQLEVAVNMYNLNQNSPDGVKGWQDWTVVDVHNDENGSGYYGCLIDTGDGNAIIGSRGSESYDTEQTVKDWVIADGGMLSSDSTAQEEEAAKYANELWEKYGKDYRYEMIGHSLGGTLSFHMMLTAPEGMYEYIDSAINLDGPGANNVDYIKKHQKEIDERGGKMTHYSWSWVSALLITLPGVAPVFIEAENDPSHKGILGNFFRHDTHNVHYDENGNFISDGVEKTAFAKGCGNTSDVFELLEYWGVLEPIGTLIAAKNLKHIPTIVFAVTMIKITELFFGEVNETIEEVKNLYYKFFNKVSGQYEVSYQCLNETSTTLQAEREKINNKVTEIEHCLLTMLADAPNCAYYKSKAWDKCYELRWNANRLGQLSDKAFNAMLKYSKADEEVSTYYTVVQV